jgi:hypothetical protein
LKRVVVTGMSGISPLGTGWEETSLSLRARKNFIAAMPDWAKFKGLNTNLGAPITKLDLPADSVNISSLELKAPALLLSGKADVKSFSAKPDVDADLSLDVDLTKLADLLPPSTLKKIPGELKSSGKIRLSVQARGGAADLKAMDLKGQLAFDQVDLAYGSYPGLAGMQGTLSVDKAGADLPELDFKLGGDPVRIKLNAKWGSLENLLGKSADLKAKVAAGGMPQLSLQAKNLAPKLSDASKGLELDISATVSRDDVLIRFAVVLDDDLHFTLDTDEDVRKVHDDEASESTESSRDLSCAVSECECAVGRNDFHSVDHCELTVHDGCHAASLLNRLDLSERECLEVCVTIDDTEQLLRIETANSEELADCAEVCELKRTAVSRLAVRECLLDRAIHAEVVRTSGRSAIDQVDVRVCARCLIAVDEHVVELFSP